MSWNREIGVKDLAVAIALSVVGILILGIALPAQETWRGRKHAGTKLPVFLEAKSLKPFISHELESVLTPVIFPRLYTLHNKIQPGDPWKERPGRKVEKIWRK